MSFIRDTLKLRKEKSKGKISQFSEEAQEEARLRGLQNEVDVREMESDPKAYYRKLETEAKLRNFCENTKRCEQFVTCFDRSRLRYDWNLLERCESPIVKKTLIEHFKREAEEEEEEEIKSKDLQARVQRELKSIDIYADKKSGRWQGQTPYPYTPYSEGEHIGEPTPEWINELREVYKQMTASPLEKSPELVATTKKFLETFEAEIPRKKSEVRAKEEKGWYDSSTQQADYEAEARREEDERQLLAETKQKAILAQKRREEEELEEDEE